MPKKEPVRVVVMVTEISDWDSKWDDTELSVSTSVPDNGRTYNVCYIRGDLTDTIQERQVVVIERTGKLVGGWENYGVPNPHYWRLVTDE